MNFRLSLIAGFLLALCISTSAMASAYTTDDITRLGNEYSGISNEKPSSENGWYISETSIWTAWANQWVEYTADLTEGTWNIGLNAINNGNLGEDWYAVFNITSDFGDDLSTTIYVTASDEEEFASYFTAEILTAGTYTVRYTWTNDQYSAASSLDANIMITSVFFDDLSTPEPATLFLTGLGLLTFARITRKRYMNNTAS